MLFFFIKLERIKETEIELEECYRAIEEVQSYLKGENFTYGSYYVYNPGQWRNCGSVNHLKIRTGANGCKGLNSNYPNITLFSYCDWVTDSGTPRSFGFGCDENTYFIAALDETNGTILYGRLGRMMPSGVTSEDSIVIEKINELNTHKTSVNVINMLSSLRQQKINLESKLI